MSDLSFYCDFNQKKLTLPIIFNKTGKVSFYVYGDSYSYLHAFDHNSWLYKVAQHFNAKITNFSVPGASEQTIFHTYVSSFKEPRDLTLIFHTHTYRTDRFFSKNRIPLNKKFYTTWDRNIITPCIHLYWADFTYSFKNGSSIFCEYPPSNEKYVLHHMSYENNTLFAEDVIEHMTNYL